MFVRLLFPDPPGLALEEVRLDATGLAFFLVSTTPQVVCPCCGELTTRRHSRYARTLADAPCATHPVRLFLSVRRFFCSNRACPQRIFTERLPGLAAPSARRTTRLTAVLQQIGLALGGEPGARLSQTLGLRTNPTALLRLIRQTPEPSPALPRIIGMDDFAFRKGQTYGTILVDLETGQPLDLLPDRSAESVAAWLRAHPTIVLITRDRAEVYANGATQGAPQATQVADRWHLLHNLGEMLEEVLTRLYPELCQALTAAAPPAGDPPLVQTTPRATNPGATGAADVLPAAPSTAPARARRAHLQQQRRAARLARYEEVPARHQAGHSISQIAAALGIGRRTVQRFLRVGRFPERQPRTPSVSRLDPYKAYLRERWTAGCHNRARLWREVQAQGYPGSYTSVYAFLIALSGGAGGRTGKGSRGPARPSVRRREWQQWLGRPAAELSAEEAQMVEQVCRNSTVLGTVYELVQRFGQLVRDQARGELDRWLQAALTSGVAEVVRFAQGIQRDYAAVAAALEVPWSNGPVEGHVNRLKVIKRQMYGRAKFALLRKRVLCAV